MDTIPIICAAGYVDKTKHETAASLLKIYTKDDLGDQIMITKNREIRRNKNLNCVPDTGIKKKLQTEEQSVKNLIEPILRKFRFKIFEEEFFENLYYQSAKKPLGKSGKSLSKPVHITNVSQTFGTESIKSLYPVLPTTEYYDIIKESLVGHENYLISHDSYFPSEKINRKYDRNVFNPNMTFGKEYNVDVSGGNVKRVLKECEDSFCIINTIQDNKLKKQHSVLSKIKTKQDLNLDPNYICGHPPRTDKIHGKMLLQNLPECPKLLELYRSISYLNSKRLQLKKKDFPFHEVEVSLKSHDPSRTGSLPWELVFNVLHQHHLLVNVEKIKSSIIYFKATDTNAENVYYDKLLKLIMASYPLPQLTNLIKLPKIDPEILTTYRELTTDRCRYPIKYTNAFDEDDYISEYPKCAPEQSKVDIANLGYETDMGGVLSPSIAAQYGLSHRDYLIPRTQLEIQEIFKSLLRDIDIEHFQDIWNDASKLITSRDNLVSVEAFRFILSEFRKKKTTNS